MKTLLLIDGHAIIHRAFHALPPLTNRDGTPTNAIYGFFTMLYKAINDFKPDYMVVCFDSPKPNFRKELYEGYQATRPTMVDDLKPQISLIKELLDKAHIKRIEKEGFEADDLIGTLATAGKKEDIKTLILTSDKDIMQLVNEKILVVSPLTGLSSIKLYTPEEVETKLDIKPEQIPDYKALSGDPSDNYPGAQGIGSKTAAKLLHQFSNVENLYAHINDIPNEKQKEILLSNKDNVMVFKKIATIVTDVPIDLTLDQTAFSGFHPEMKQKLQKLHLNTLLKRFFEEKKLETPKPPKTETPPADNSSQIDLF